MRNGPRGPLKLVCLTVLVLGILLGTASCVSINVVDEGSGRTELTRPAPPEIRGATELHDVAITAVDFDPPLSSSKSVQVDRLSLLAVIENKGNQFERKLVVKAKLYGLASDLPLIESESIVERLVPGESRVVRFHGIPSVPVRSAYRLDMTAQRVDGEWLVSNNVKSFRVEVSRLLP